MTQKITNGLMDQQELSPRIDGVDLPAGVTTVQRAANTSRAAGRCDEDASMKIKVTGPEHPISYRGSMDCNCRLGMLQNESRRREVCNTQTGLH